MACGNGSDRTQHPEELFGEDWANLGLDPFARETDDETAKTWDLTSH